MFDSTPWPIHLPGTWWARAAAKVNASRLGPPFGRPMWTRWSFIQPASNTSSLVALADDPIKALWVGIGLVAYQQVENYVIYPKVMSRSVDIPGSLIVIAALIGAALLGVVGALLAIPTAAAVLMVVREVVVPKLDRR